MERARILSVCLFVLLVSFGCREPAPSSPEEEASTSAPGADWPRWRGPNGQGVSAETGLPATWDAEGTNIRWQTAIPGAGNSSPIAIGNRVFLTTAYGQRGESWAETWDRPELDRVVLSLDLASGELLWETIVFRGDRSQVHYDSSRAAPSPVSDGERVYVSFDSTLAALDLEGRVLWQRDLDPGYYEHAHYGVASSPVLAGDLLILMQDREEGDSADEGWLAAVDTASGEERWRQTWSHTCCSYTTPVLIERTGRQQLVISSSGEIVGYDPATGEPLWRAAAPNTQPVPSLIVSGDLIAAPGAMHDRLFSLFRLSEEAGETRAELLWATHKKVPKIPTPLFYEGRLFVLTDNRILTAYEPESGEELWKGRVAGGDYWSSPVAGDGKLYTLNEYGTVTVVDARADRFRKIAESSIDKPIRGASMAIGGGCILIRSENALTCAALPS